MQSCPLRHARQQEYVIGEGQFHGKDLQPASNEQFAAVRLVKDVMVKTAVVEVVQGSAMKIAYRVRSWINTEIVFLQDFGQVEQVVFRCSPAKVFKHVVHLRWRPPMIEGTAVVRQKQNKGAARPYHSLPLVERFERIRKVLQGMR